MIRNLRWGDVAQLKYGKSIREYPQVASDSHRFRVFGTNGPIGWHTTPLVPSAGIIIGRKGAYRGVHFSDSPFFVIDTAYYLDIFDPELDVKWAYYQLLTVDINRMDSGSAIPSTKREDFDAVPVRIPLKSTQQRIADILSNYDDLIENNRRRIALLEESARQLYQEWFVRLRFPGHEHTRVVNGVPEGWAHTQLSTLIDIKHGYAFQGSNFSDEETSRVLMTPGNFAIGGGLKIEKLKYYSDEGPLDASYVLGPMDLVLTMTDLSKQSDTLGFPALTPRIDGLTFLHNQRIGKVIPKTDTFPRFMLYCLFCDPLYRHHVLSSASGTSVKHTSPGRILSYARALPTSGGFIAEFDRSLQPFFQQINCLLEMNQKLRAARDLLLPRLMSGEVAV